jgi:hypothetical protein
VLNLIQRNKDILSSSQTKKKKVFKLQKIHSSHSYYSKVSNTPPPPFKGKFSQAKEFFQVLRRKEFLFECDALK